MAEKKVKKKRNTARIIISLGLFVISGLLLYSVFQEVMTTISLTSDLKAVQEKLLTIENEKRDLQERKEKLEDPNYIKSYARGEYSITKEGEQVFRLPSKKDKPSENNEASEDNQ